MEKYTIGLYEKAMPGTLSWQEKLEAAKKAGFDYIEISIDETDEKLARLDMPKAERMMLINTCLVMGMPIRSMCLSGHRKFPIGSNDPAIEARGMEIMEKAINLADDLGIRIIQLAGYDVYYEKGNEDTKDRFVKNLAKAVNMASAKAIVLGFETMETEFMNITNAACLYHTDAMKDLTKGQGHIVAVHLKETVPGKFREVPFGTGHVDFDKAIETAWKLGVRKYVTEFWYTGNPSWEEDLKEANSMMRKILNRQP